ncbi:unnamed protein product [Parascedosporium putredinis]|uniref:Uncharacterized protein n=1 Tax=Parascedosporium putredinis TaxID=1442378 RepID=A0A9P1HAB4_9PEZI|nr:unnamed protein product [Parascedosporium putredinis]CAI8001195.1 unnamed protein product [Parascedosporium putredinis]
MVTNLSSGGGGFYKYRCKYFYSKSCQNWVYVNGEACMQCLADGCDAQEHHVIADDCGHSTEKLPISGKTMLQRVMDEI